ncbi:hypothetical protein KR222_009305, partial [Zaprionus bogoriensis]
FFPITYVPETKGCECWRPENPSCKDRVEKVDTGHLVEEDIEDIVDSLMQVMRLCRLRPWEVKRLRATIRRSFHHYEEVPYRVDRVPEKRFSKENFLHDAAVLAGMSRMDCQLAFGIVKRAFRAYYHGTAEHGRRTVSLAKQMRHHSGCLWGHAARRTAEIFAVYAGLMYSEQKQYEECIMYIYNALNTELQKRLVYEPSDDDVCICAKEEKPFVPKTRSKTKTSKRVVAKPSGTTLTSAYSLSVATTELFFNRQKFGESQETSAVSVHLKQMMVSMEEVMGNPFTANLRPLLTAPTSEPTTSYKSDVSRMLLKAIKKFRSKRKGKKKRKCKCPEMEAKERPPPAITAESSQGPYICRWLPYGDEEEFTQHCVPFPPMEKICPPCKEKEDSCDEECTCTCQVCTCPPAYDDDMLGEEEHGEQLSGTGLEDRDTDFCWLAPFRDWPMAEEDQDIVEEEEEQEEEQKSISEVSNLRDSFTYLKPFRSETAVPVTVKPPSTPEPFEKWEPPYGVRMETYRCWTEP